MSHPMTPFLMNSQAIFDNLSPNGPPFLATICRNFRVFFENFVENVSKFVFCLGNWPKFVWFLFFAHLLFFSPNDPLFWRKNLSQNKQTNKQKIPLFSSCCLKELQETRLPKLKWAGYKFEMGITKTEVLGFSLTFTDSLQQMLASHNCRIRQSYFSGKRLPDPAVPPIMLTAIFSLFRF